MGIETDEDVSVFMPAIIPDIHWIDDKRLSETRINRK